MNDQLKLVMIDLEMKMKKERKVKKKTLLYILCTVRKIKN